MGAMNISREKLFEKAEAYVHAYIPEAKIDRDNLCTDSLGWETIVLVTFPLKENRRKMEEMECFDPRHKNKIITKDENGNKIVTQYIYFDKDGNMKTFPRNNKRRKYKRIAIQFAVYMAILILVYLSGNIELFGILTKAGVISFTIIAIWC